MMGGVGLLSGCGTLSRPSLQPLRSTQGGSRQWRELLLPAGAACSPAPLRAREVGSACLVRGRMRAVCVGLVLIEMVKIVRAKESFDFPKESHLSFVTDLETSKS